jgi:hypothetical protein
MSKRDLGPGGCAGWGGLLGIGRVNQLDYRMLDGQSGGRGLPRDSLHVFVCLSTSGLLFSPQATRICDQWHLEFPLAFGLLIKPMSGLRSAIGA